MQYKYATENQDFSDFSSGRVFYSLPGYPAFPVRLASEIFQRCMASREKLYANPGPCTLYDPCCGAAYQLSVLGFLHGDRIREIIASDIDEKAVHLAKQNLGLLTIAGLDKRIAEIASLLEQHGKDSHKQALASAHILKNKIPVGGREHPLTARAFQASAFDSQAPGKNIKPASVDIVFTDVPYGQHSRWQGSTPDEFSNPPWSVLDALLDILSPSSIVAIVSNKQQKVFHESFQRVEHFQVGKRRIVLLKPV